MPVDSHAMSQPFTCTDCGAEFELPPAVLAKYPDWVPRQCLACRDAKGGGSKRRGRTAPARDLVAHDTPIDEDPALLRVLDRFQDGPSTGVFTDGSCSPNPGPGGWGVVWVEDGTVIDQRRGEAPDSTNNRMELQALIEACRMVPADRELTVYSDSQLVVKTVNEWAAGWERKGWKRKSGPIANLDLVQELWALVKERPQLRFEWARAHSGWRWNEYADALASTHLRRAPRP